MDPNDVKEIVQLLGHVVDLEEDLKSQFKNLNRRVTNIEKHLRLNQSPPNTKTTA